MCCMPDQLPARRRRLRRESTNAERVLWRALRARQIGAKFRRQHPLGHYIVDFYCRAARLVIELDGGQHYEPEHAAYDARRTRELVARGEAVIRFTNVDVLRTLDVVLDVIARAVTARTEGARERRGGLALTRPHPGPLPQRGRGR